MVAGVFRTMSARGGRVKSATAAIGLLGLTCATVATDAVEAQPEPVGFAELAVGEWLGNGRASGVSTAATNVLAITVDGGVSANMEFAVDIDGSLSGTWVLEGASTASFAGPGGLTHDSSPTASTL